MKFNFFEMVTILRAILSADKHILSLDIGKKYYTDEQRAIVDKFFSACQECPSMIDQIQSIMAKLQSSPPKSYRKKRKRKQK